MHWPSGVLLLEGQRKFLSNLTTEKFHVSAGVKDIPNGESRIDDARPSEECENTKRLAGLFFARPSIGTVMGERRRGLGCKLRDVNRWKPYSRAIY